jgi:hypothetical protein
MNWNENVPDGTGQTRLTLPVVESGVDVECEHCGNIHRIAEIPLDNLLCDDCRDDPAF